MMPAQRLGMKQTVYNGTREYEDVKEYTLLACADERLLSTAYK